MTQDEDYVRTLTEWFRQNGGSVDTSVMSFQEFPGHGRGAVALRDIPEGHTLFTIPRSLTLSTRTCKLPGLLGRTWKKHKLHQGWSGLILCMLWEASLGHKSQWSGYMETMPTTFHTPIFWKADELQELEGTAVVDKIGRDEAEEDYHKKLIPAVQERPDIFLKNEVNLHYTLNKYHMMGSRILSRSFHVERWSNDQNDGNGDDLTHLDPEESTLDADTSQTSIASNGMDVDEDVGLQAIADEVTASPAETGDEASDNEDDEDPSDVAMVPMADMLNARYGSENAKLFYEPEDLKMMTTKSIKAGEQIWNTYGDPPNSDLLRRYGYVDIIDDNGSPADIVEIRADLVVKVVSSINPKIDGIASAERVDWWLEEGGDDMFVVETDLAIPDPLVSFIRVLLSSQADWEKMREKSKLPKPRSDKSILEVVIAVLRQRQNDYPTSLEDDECYLLPDVMDALSLNKRHAVIVRYGEKRILNRAANRAEGLLEALTNEAGGRAKAVKRRGPEINQDKSRNKRVK